MDPSTDSSIRGEGLDPNLWCNFPHTLWESVIPFLPFPVIIQLRVVCRSWNELITTPSFALKCARSEKVALAGRGVFRAVPLLSPEAGAKEVAVYRCCPVRGKWEKLAVGGESGKARSLIVCSGGLLCFETDDPERYVICNPLTRRSREVECPFKAGSSDQTDAKESCYAQRVVGLVVDSDTGNYKLVTVSLGVGGVGRSTSIYDSWACTWKTGAPITRSPNDEEETFVSEGAVTCDGSVYCFVAQYRARVPSARKWRLLQYKVETDCWSDVVLDFKDSIPAEIVQVGFEVLVVYNVASRKWLPSGAYQTIWYHRFHLVQSGDGQDLRLRHPSVEHSFRRTIIREILQQKESRPHTRMCCSFAGGNGDVYFTHQYKRDDPERRPDDSGLVTVGRFSGEQNAFLPTFEHNDPTVRWHPSTSGEADQVGGGDKPQMKIWMLQPSLTAMV